MVTLQVLAPLAGLSPATGPPRFQAGGNLPADPSLGAALSPAGGAPASFGGLTSPPSRPSASASRHPSTAPSMPGYIHLSDLRRVAARIAQVLL